MFKVNTMRVLVVVAFTLFVWDLGRIEDYIDTWTFLLTTLPGPVVRPRPLGSGPTCWDKNKTNRTEVGLRS